MKLKDNNRITGNKTVSDLSEAMVLICMGLWVFLNAKDSNTFFIPVSETFTDTLNLLTMVCILFRMLLDGKLKEKVSGILFYFLFGILTVFSGYSFFFGIGTVILASCCCNYKKVVKVFLLSSAVPFVISVAAASCGAIKNLVYFADGSLRSSFGICYPTDFSSYLVYFVLALWVLGDDISEGAVIVLALISSAIALVFTQSMTGIFSSLLIIPAVICHAFGKRKRRQPGLIGVVDCAAAFSFVAFSAAMFLLLYLYGRGVPLAVKYDSFFHNRLSNAWSACQKYGIRPFGSMFEMIGGGGSTFSKTGYNFIDCTYLLLLIRYGWVSFLAMAVLWGVLACRAIRNQHREILYAMAVIAVHSLSEHHYFDLSFNFLLLLPAAVIPKVCGEKESAACLSENRKVRPVPGFNTVWLYAFIAASAVLLTPAVSSQLQTVCSINGFSAGTEWYKPFFLLLSVLAVCTLFFFFLFQTVRSGAKGRRISRRLVFGLLLSCGCVLGGYEQIFFAVPDSVMRGYQEQLEAERDVIQLITASSSGKVVVDGIPAVYREKFNGIDYSLLKGEDLAREENVSVLMDSQFDSECFIKMGFLCCTVSDRHVLYTNDVQVVEALRSRDYAVVHHYTGTVKADMKRMAEVSGKICVTGNTVLLSGNEDSLNGPSMGLYSGRYTVSVPLRIDPSKKMEGDRIAEICVTALGGEKLLGSREVKSEEFGNNGKALAEIVFESQDYEDIEYKIYLKTEDTALTVGQISVRRTPEYDTVVSYGDAILRLTRKSYTVTSYYDSDNGTRMLLPGGYSACRRDYNANGTVRKISYYGLKDEPVLINAGYHSIEYERNSKNLVSAERYFDKEGNPVAISKGYCGYTCEYDENGNVNRYIYLGSDGKPVMLKEGYAQLRRKYKGKQIVREEYYDETGSRVLLKDGCSAVNKTYDSSGNVESVSCFGVGDEPVLSKNGYHKITYQYDSRKQIVRECYFGTDGKRMILGKGYSGAVYGYDEQGNRNTVQYLDREDQPVQITGGYAALFRVYDGKKRVIREEYFDTAGERTTLADNYWAWEKEYYADGTVSSVRYYDVNDSPCLFKGKYHLIRYSCNSSKQVIREMYFDGEEKPKAQSTGEYGVQFDYDRAGNRNDYIYLDQTGRPVMLSAGYAERYQEFNSEKKIVRELYLDLDKEKVLLPKGYCSVKYSYDAAGNKTGVQYFGLNDEPVMITDGYSSKKSSYDSSGRVIREEYFDSEGKNIKLSDGFWAVEMKYNKNGKVTEQRYYDAGEKPALYRGRYHRIVFEYDDRGRVSEEMYFGQNNEPAAQEKGQYGVRYGYDERGNTNVWIYLNESGEPLLTDGGYAEVRKEYDTKKRVIREDYFDGDGNRTITDDEYSGVVYSYDDTAGTCVISYRDTDDNQVLNNLGYGAVFRIFDEKGRVRREEYFDENGERTECTGGYWAFENQYDPSGRLSSVKYYDTDGNRIEM